MFYAILGSMMESRRQIWQEWNHHLEKWGLRLMTANLLEAFRPLNILGAQMLYIGQPFLGMFTAKGHTDELARILEEPDELQVFLQFLRQENPT